MELTTADFKSYKEYLMFLQKVIYKNVNIILKDEKFVHDLYKEYKQKTIKHRYWMLKY